MLAVVDAGGQAAFCAHRVLAQQHAATISAMLGDLGADASWAPPTRRPTWC